LLAEYSPGAYGKQDWQGLDGISGGMKADFSHPIPASPVFRPDLPRISPIPFADIPASSCFALAIQDRNDYKVLQRVSERISALAENPHPL
jgi:hypothetical protein